LIKPIVLIPFLLAAAAPAQVNVLTGSYDNQRTNSNLQETILNQSNVNTANFGKIGYLPVDGEIYAQPLYASGIQITGQGLHNVVYVATMHDSVYAIDADKPSSPTPLWSVNLGPSVPSWVLSFNDILPEVGILSTPVIDLTRQVIYVVSDTLEAGIPAFSLHALSLADGQEMLGGPVTISASLPGHGAGNTGGTVTFNPSIELQRPAIALANGKLYLCFGSRADMGNWHGWLMSYDAATLKQIAFVNTSANGYGASIWHSGLAPAIDASGNVYVATGNGDFDGSVNFSESVLKFSGADLTLADWYTPNTWDDLNSTDSDLGSSGVILLPATSQVVTAGKSGDLFLVKSDSMGHLGPKNTSTVQNIQANQAGTHTLALWNSPSNPVLYIHESNHALSAFDIVNGRINATASSVFTPNPSTVFANVAISSDSNGPGSAIVWYSVANYNVTQQPGTLHALDASDLTHELWNSDMVATDAMGRFAKFVVPTVANGRVYVPTFSNELVIYGLLTGASGPSDQGAPQVTAIANSANFLSGTIAPGELVTIFGANLGPTLPVGSQVDNTGHLAYKLSQTKVFFNGVSAPLLYASANQVSAIVPFATAPAKIQVQVQNGSQFSPNSPVIVAPAAPALFSKDGTGGRIGAIINQNGTTNSYGNPAPRGSVVTMFATGAGQTNPGGNDGQITSGTTYPVPQLPVKLFIDGQSADVLYAGAAPGQVQGVIQINARVPASASTGQVNIVLQVGSYSSPNTTTVIVQ
jgi:uncharacterized protein (TIGR03437 family)